MPTHRDLVNAEVAFILYDGQVYMSHPSDPDVSLTKLIRQIGNLGHLDNPLVESIQAFLRGSENAPNGLELVGRYNMSNGRLAPYGPVNSAENQNTVRNAIQQAAYDTSGSPQEPAGGDASTNPAPDIQSQSSWRMGRQFMPLVEKITQDKCPFCLQERSLYVMKDGYLAQAMGVHGYPLCRDCLTTRMDQHEQSTGQHIAHRVSRRGFVRTSADVQQLAENMISRIYEEGLVPKNPGNKEHLYQQRFMELMGYLLKEAPETYKLWPFLARSFKKDRAIVDQLQRQDIRVLLPAFAHVKDILQQATVHLERMKDDPRPEVRVPNLMQEFKPGPNGNYSWDQLQQWVYDQNAQHGTPDMEDADTVYEWPDGWTIKELGPDALGKEGELMGHCVGGYCNDVRTHSSHIYSLRDPKNQPHVTFEVEGQPAYERLNPDRTPEEEQLRSIDQSANSLDPSVYTPAMGQYEYQKRWRPALTPPNHPQQPSGPWSAGEFLPHPSNEGEWGVPGGGYTWPSWKVIQIQGKQDKEPIPEYRQRINEYMTYLREKEGVQVEWHPEDSIRPGGEREDYISDIDEALEYYREYQQGNTNSHEYPSIQTKDKQYDDYGLPHSNFGDDSGLYVARNGGLEDLVSQACDGLTSNENRRTIYYHTDYTPEEAAQAILFLVEQLKIKEKGYLVTQHGTPLTDWDAELQKAIQAGWEKIDRERDEIRENNWDFEGDVMQNAHEEMWNNYNSDNGFEEGDEGYVDPNDKEIDYEHPDMQHAQEYIDHELYTPWNQAVEFMQYLQAGTAMKQHPDNIRTMGEPDRPAPADVQYEMNQDPDIGIPGTLSRWQLQSLR